MSSAATKAWMSRYIEALEKSRSEETIRRFVENEDLVQHILMFESAFPGYEILTDDVIAEGDKLAIRGRFRGTHRGEFMGIGPTGSAVEMPLQLMYRIADDKVVEFWMTADTLALMQQIGVAPVPA